MTVARKRKFVALWPWQPRAGRPGVPRLLLVALILAVILLWALVSVLSGSDPPGGAAG